jgi:hypothetical protein
MNDLFDRVYAKQEQLDELAERLLKMASLLGLHAWYQSRGGVTNINLATAADEAETAALILRGEPVDLHRIQEDRHAG